MTTTDGHSAAVFFMSSTGALMEHVCDQQNAHPGNHTCQCGYEWPRSQRAFEGKHQPYTPPPPPPAG